jgi:hypothetical protein
MLLTFIHFSLGNKTRSLIAVKFFGSEAISTSDGSAAFFYEPDALVPFAHLCLMRIVAYDPGKRSRQRRSGQSLLLAGLCRRLTTQRGRSLLSVMSLGEVRPLTGSRSSTSEASEHLA